MSNISIVYVRKINIGKIILGGKMYNRSNEIELEKSNLVYSEFSKYLYKNHEVVVADINYYYREENTYVKIGLHTTDDYIKVKKYFLSILSGCIIGIQILIINYIQHLIRI